MFYACSIEKRHYLPGYHIEWVHGFSDNQVCKESISDLNTKISRSAEQEKFNEQLFTQSGDNVIIEYPEENEDKDIDTTTTHNRLLLERKSIREEINNVLPDLKQTRNKTALKQLLRGDTFLTPSRILLLIAYTLFIVASILALFYETAITLTIILYAIAIVAWFGALILRFTYY